MESEHDFKHITENFKIEGKFVHAHPYGFGHINDTFAVYFYINDSFLRRYILQRINTNVFKSPENLMDNIGSVTSHLRKKIMAENGDPQRETLNIIPSKSGGNYYESCGGDFWRTYVFIENAATYQIVENEIHFYNAGRAFGNFQRRLSDFPAGSLHETIPAFHNTPDRYEKFLKAVSDDPFKRVSKIQNELDFVKFREKDIHILTALAEKGDLPLRVTHNDTKFNNVMIDDETGAGICVIDLDTVMPGLSLYDFGDSIRSGASTAKEDEKDMSKVELDINLFESFSKGFLEYTHSFLTLKEIEHLAFSAKLMTFECAMRFLTDYINGDTYFKIKYPEHNLVRANNQFKLVESMERKMFQMEDIVEKTVKKLSK